MSLFDLSFAVNALGAVEYTITRPGSQTFVNGRKTDAAGSTFQALLNVQPASGKTLARAQELYHVNDAVSIHTSSNLSVGSDVLPLRNGDTFSHGGRTYTIVEHEDWTNHGNFSSYLAISKASA